MPHRYQGHFLPAPLLANSWDYIVGIICLLSGLGIASNNRAAPNSIQSLPVWLTATYMVVLILAGLLILTGATRRYRTTWGSGLEEAGLWFAGTGFFAYAVALILYPDTRANSFQLILINLFVALGCAIRAKALSIEADYALRVLRSTPRPETWGTENG